MTTLDRVHQLIQAGSITEALAAADPRDVEDIRHWPVMARRGLSVAVRRPEWLYARPLVEVHHRNDEYLRLWVRAYRVFRHVGYSPDEAARRASRGEYIPF